MVTKRLLLMMTRSAPICAHTNHVRTDLCAPIIHKKKSYIWNLLVFATLLVGSVLTPAYPAASGAP